MNETYSAWECSALREVHIVLDTNKTYPKLRDYLFSFNLNLDLFTLALENLYFNTLDREKVQGKSLGCIKSLGTPHPHTPIQGATAKGWKCRMRLGSRGLPTPDLNNTWWSFRTFYLTFMYYLCKCVTLMCFRPCWPIRSLKKFPVGGDNSAGSDVTSQKLRFPFSRSLRVTSDDRRNWDLARETYPLRV